MLKNVMLPAALLSTLLCFPMSNALAQVQGKAQVRQLPGFRVAETDFSIATGVNPAGQVAGIVGDQEGRRHAVLYDGELVRLPSLGGEQSETAGINRHGVVVGSAEISRGRWRAFLYRRGEPMRDLGSLSDDSSFGAGLNDIGQAVGMARTDDGYFHAFVTSADGEMQDLGTLGGKASNAAGINNSGVVVGTSALADGYRHAFLYRPGQGMRDLGTLGGGSSAATAINDAGMVAGAAQVRSGRWHAFLHDGSRMIDLGAMIGHGDSFATGINAAGHVVGTILIADERRTFVYRAGKMAVHHSGKSLYLANGINDRGMVVGARFDTKRFAAAVMPAAMTPFVDRGSSKLSMMSLAGVLLAAAAVIVRKCYLGIRLATG